MIKLVYKYIKHGIFKFPLKFKTYSENRLYDIPEIFTTAYTELNVQCNVIYKKSKFYINKNFSYIHYWIFIGYAEQKSIYNCSWKEFKNIYTSLFYPYLISDSDIVLNILNNNKKNIDTPFLIKKI